MSKYKSNKRQQKTSFQDILPTPLLIALGGFALVAVALFAFWKASQKTSPQVPVEVKGAPSLKVDQELVDLGDVPLGKTVSVSFQLTNVGDKTLQFNSKPFVEVVEGC